MDNESGFIADISGEMQSQSPVISSSSFSELQECYVSKSGHTRLFTAIRYGKRYMLKCLKKDYLFTPVYQHLLRKEFEIGIQLNHPHICQTIGWEIVADIGDTIIMEYIDGVTLDVFLKSSVGRDSSLAYPLLSQLVDALSYMHSKQIVHRDLKPSNIMITYNGNSLKLIDFSLSDSDAFSILKLPAGTRHYAAPEQLLPEAHADVRSDIYSFGVIVLELSDILHDDRLASVARKCMKQDADLRPAYIRDIVIPAPLTYNVKAYTIAAIILSFTATLLLLYILSMLL